MRFVNESIKQFARARSAAWSKNYVICSTGGQIKIFDKGLNLLQTIKDVKNIYKCLISPDEKKLLLISTANFFYIVELDTFCVTKHTIKGEYGDNLEGRGCWTLDGKGCCFCVASKVDVKSALRIYDDIQNDKYRDLFSNKYWLTSIVAIPKLNKYLLTGYDHSKAKNYLIWYDGNEFEQFAIHTLSQNDVARSAKYVENSNHCIVIGSDSTIFCRIDGTPITMPLLWKSEEKHVSFMDAFKTINFEEENRRAVEELSALYGLENLAVPDTIMDICQSNNGRYFYVATLGRLLCINANTHKIDAEKTYPFGVTDVEEISEGLLLVKTWGSIELLRLVL